MDDITGLPGYNQPQAIYKQSTANKRPTNNCAIGQQTTFHLLRRRHAGDGFCRAALVRQPEGASQVLPLVCDRGDGLHLVYVLAKRLHRLPVHTERRAARAVAVVVLLNKLRQCTTRRQVLDANKSLNCSNSSNTAPDRVTRVEHPSFPVKCTQISTGEPQRERRAETD